MLENVGIIPSSAYSTFVMALHDVLSCNKWILHTINIIVCFYQREREEINVCLLEAKMGLWDKSLLQSMNQFM